MDTLSDTLNIETFDDHKYCSEYVDKAMQDPAMPQCAKCKRKDYGYVLIDHSDGAKTHYARMICNHCSNMAGRSVALQPNRNIPKPGNNGKTKKADTYEARAHYRKQNNGILKCWLCEVFENQTSAGFDIHHLDWIEEKGCKVAKPEETRPLCKPCHQLLTNLKKNMSGHTRGIVRIDTSICGINGSLCSASVECHHGDCEDCPSRIEVA